MYSIPEDIDTSFKSWMPHTSFVDEESDQYRLQQEAYTDENGFRRYNDDYIVAMGTHYSNQCGERFLIQLDSQLFITVITGDIKADSDTDETNRFSPIKNENGEVIGANILEFIVDESVMSNDVLKLGTVSSLGLEGNIISIIKMGNEIEY